MSKALLTQVEVDALPDGARVIIRWGVSGDGPHEYAVQRVDGVVWAWTTFTCSDNIAVAPIAGVGSGKCDTRVWRA